MVSADKFKDLHSKNVLFLAPSMFQFSDYEIMSCFGQPITGSVKRHDGQRCPPSMPSYLVKPISMYGNNVGIKIYRFWDWCEFGPSINIDKQN